MSLGEELISAFFVDLFYIAVEDGVDEIDAAFADTTTSVANAAVAKLTATGAVSNFSLVVSPAELIVVVLFLKK